MDIEEEDPAYVSEGEGDEEWTEEDDEEEETEEEESEDEEEEAEQLEEMRPPVVTSWVGPDGITVHGIVCIDDGVIRLNMNQSPFENCPICYEPPTTTHGKHRICCLPCGHMYGLSCINKWLRVIYSYSQCPQCNTVFPYENPILLYPPGLRDTTAHQETSSATLFPFTEQGLLEFKKYEHSRMLDARSLKADDITHTNILVRKHNGLAHCARELQRRHNYHLTRAEKLEGRPDSLGLADASRSRASRLQQQIDALVQRAATLEQLVIALRQRSDALGQRYDAFESRVGFGCQMYEEHHNGEKEIAQAKQALEMKKNLAEKEAAKAKMNDQKEAEKKLNDDIVDVPEEVTAEDVAEVPDEEDIMESDEEDIMESEEEDIMESEEEESEEDQEEEAEQLEEMRPPVVTSWVGPDGITVHGLMCIDDGVIRLKNQWRFEDCSICYKPSTYHGKHRICCLPCGHMYGLLCINKWLRLSSSSGQCPQCNTFCSSENPILLYPPGIRDTTAHQETSSATLFPFTEQGLLEFKKYEHSRMLDARSLQADDITHTNILVRKHNGLAHCARELQRRRNYHLTRAEKLEGRPDSLGLADASRSRANRLQQQIDALVQRAATLEQLVIALRQRSDALGQRYDAFESRVGFGCQMYKEHHNGEKEIAQAKQDLEEVMGEDVAEEPEEEKVEVKAEPTTKTTGCVRVRGRSNRGKGPDSMKKGKKSKNYMYYYAAAVLIVSFAVGYTLYV